MQRPFFYGNSGRKTAFDNGIPTLSKRPCFKGHKLNRRKTGDPLLYIKAFLGVPILFAEGRKRVPIRYVTAFLGVPILV